MSCHSVPYSMILELFERIDVIEARNGPAVQRARPRVTTYISHVDTVVLPYRYCHLHVDTGTAILGSSSLELSIMSS
jgi:hypothetical protein